MENELTRRFREKVEAEKPNLKKLSIALNVNYDRMYKWLKGKGNPKSEDEKKVDDWVNGTSSIESSKVQDNKESTREGISLEALYKLIDANQKLAESQKDFAETNRRLADTNERLTKILERKVDTTGNVDPQIQQADQTMIGAFQELLLDVAVGTKYRTREEAHAALLNKFVPSAAPKKASKDTQKG